MKRLERKQCFPDSVFKKNETETAKYSLGYYFYHLTAKHIEKAECGGKILYERNGTGQDPKSRSQTEQDG